MTTQLWCQWINISLFLSSILHFGKGNIIFWP